MRVPTLGCSCFHISSNSWLQLLSENSISKKDHNHVKIFWITSPADMGSPFDSKQLFRVNIFSNDKDIRICQSFCATQATTELWQYLDVFFSKTTELKKITNLSEALFMWIFP